jgi:hypothetical protein
MKLSLRPSRTPSTLSDSVQHHLNLYALAANAAGLGMLTLPQSAEAKIVYTPAKIHVFGYPCIPLDVNHDGNPDFWFCGVYNGTDCVTSVELGIDPQSDLDNAVWDRGSDNAAALRSGARVGRGKPFSRQWLLMGAVSVRGGECTSHQSTVFRGQWENRGKGVTNRYLGLKFQIKGKTHYGWARLTFPGGFYGVSQTTLTGYAYETTRNKPIEAGETKGPDVVVVQPDTAHGTLGRLAMGRK